MAAMQSAPCRALLPSRRVSGDFHRDSGRSSRKSYLVFHSAKRRSASIFLAAPTHDYINSGAKSRGLFVRAMVRPPALVLRYPKSDLVSEVSKDECRKKLRQTKRAAPQRSRLARMDCFKGSARRANHTPQRLVSIPCWEAKFSICSRQEYHRQPAHGASQEQCFGSMPPRWRM